VAGVDNGLFREGEDFFADAGEKLIPVTSRKIPAAHAIGKENVAPKELTGVRKMETETARAVAGNQQQLGTGPRGWHGAGLFQ